MREKIRPNFWYVATVLAFIAIVSLFNTFSFVRSINNELLTVAVVSSVLTLFVTLITTIVVGLIGSMNAVLSDPPPPMVPASTFEKQMDNHKQTFEQFMEKAYGENKEGFN